MIAPTGDIPAGLVPVAVNGALGHTGVLLGFVAAVVGVVVLAVGLVRGRDPTRPQRPALRAAASCSAGVVATVAMERALITHDFSLTYVADNNSRTTPLLYSITGMWSALAGSILLWARDPRWLRHRDGLAVPAPGGRPPRRPGPRSSSTWWPPSSSV